MNTVYDYVLGRLAKCLVWVFCGVAMVFLVAPILSVVPLSFNSEPFFSYPLAGFSFRWYEEFFNSPEWQLALRNSFIVAVFSTICACTLGTLAALGVNRPDCPFKSILMAVLISPMIIPVIVSAVGMYYAFADVGLINSLTGLVVAHTVLSTPFVVVTVMATLASFDNNLLRAAASLGASPLRAFRLVMLPLIAPGIASGALFAFVTSLEEVVVALYLAGPEQRTLPREMWSGIKQQITPTILAVATCVVVFSILLQLTVQWLRGRAARRSAKFASEVI